MKRKVIRKILVNQTQEPLAIRGLGITIAASETYEVQQDEFLLLASAVDVPDLINADKLLINDGETTLSKTNSLIHYKFSMFDENQSSFDEDKILTNWNGDVMSNHKGNVLVKGY